MSSLAIPRQAARWRVSRSLWELFSTHGSDVLLGVAITVLAAILLINSPNVFNVDSWLALVTGRELWQTGIPHHEILTVMAHGKAWVDQQWLSQLASYGIYLIGGLGLLGTVNAALIVLAVAGAAVGARRLGARPGVILITLALCLFSIAPSREVRTQEFAMPLFVAVAYLLAADIRAPSRRVYWCFPILVLWANLHGSVTQGAMLVSLRGLLILWEQRHRLRHPARLWYRPLALIVGAPLTLLLTPYGVSSIGYYRTMLFGGTLTHAVSEWAPVTSSPAIAAVFFLAVGIAIWSFGRYPERTTTWERIALLVLAAASISVIRNLLFFGLFALMVMPVSLAADPAAAQLPNRLRGRVNLGLATAALAAAVVAGAALIATPASSIELRNQRPAVLRVVARVTNADPAIRVLTDDHYADWLLWRDPSLSGRLAYDVRYELLSARQVSALQAVFTVTGVNYKQAARGYRLLVLDRRYEPATVSAFRHEPGARILFNDGDEIVILRSARQAA